MASCVDLCFQLTPEEGTWQNTTNSFRIYIFLTRRSLIRKTMNKPMLQSKNQKCFLVMHKGVGNLSVPQEYQKALIALIIHNHSWNPPLEPLPSPPRIGCLHSVTPWYGACVWPWIQILTQIDDEKSWEASPVASRGAPSACWLQKLV